MERNRRRQQHALCHSFSRFFCFFEGLIRLQGPFTLYGPTQRITQSPQGSLKSRRRIKGYTRNCGDDPRDLKIVASLFFFYRDNPLFFFIHLFLPLLPHSECRIIAVITAAQDGGGRLIVYTAGILTFFFVPHARSFSCVASGGSQDLLRSP